MAAETDITKQRENIKLLNRVLETRNIWSSPVCVNSAKGGGVCAASIFFFLTKKNFLMSGYEWVVVANTRPSYLLSNNLFNEYIKLLIFFFTALLFSLLLFSITWIFVPKKRRNTKNSSYECGYEPVGSPTAKFEVHFYIVAILFIIFDVELLFLYPWVLGVANLSAQALWAMTIFLLTLLIGFAYEWLRGALEVGEKKKNADY